MGMCIAGRFVVCSNGLMNNRIWVSHIDEKNRATAWSDNVHDAHIFDDVSAAIDCKKSVTDYRSDFAMIQGIR